MGQNRNLAIKKSVLEEMAPANRQYMLINITFIFASTSSVILNHKRALWVDG